MDNRDQQERFLDKQYQDEKNEQIKWESFRSDATSRVEQCFSEDGDLIDLINTLDLEYDNNDSLSHSQINEIIIESLTTKFIEGI